MPEDILPKAFQSTEKKEPKKPKHKISFIGVILSAFLLITLILLGERIIFDLNRTANPAVEAAVSKNQPASKTYNYSQYAYERSGLSSTNVYYQKTDKSRYITYKLLIHAAFIIPIFLLVFLFYYLFHIKKANPNLRVVIYAYFGFAFWMMLHLLGETGRYIIDQFENAAIYIILGLLVIIITPLAIFIQKKVSQRADEVV